MATSAADELRARTLAALPPLLHPLLMPSPEATPVQAALITDRDWLREQIALRGKAWPTEDEHVLATLWWFSAGHYLLTPTLATLLLTGRAVSPALADLVLHWFPDGTVSGAHSTAVLSGEFAFDPVPSLGGVADAVRETLDAAIASVSALTRHGVRPLWALATDGIADRLLLLGAAAGRGQEARALAGRLCAAIGAPLLLPRFGTVTTASGHHWPVVRRVSCCLLYRVPGQEVCPDCPRRATA